MLKEIPNCRQVDGEPYRRWFTDLSLDLIVWYSDNRDIVGFQLCYGKLDKEHALTWKPDIGFSHGKVDTGEMYGIRSDRLTPILLPDGLIDLPKLYKTFIGASIELEPDLVQFVSKQLKGSVGR